MITLYESKTPAHELILKHVSSRKATKSYFTTDCGRRATLIKNMFGLVEQQDATLIRAEFVVWINAEFPEIYKRFRVSQGLDQDYRLTPVESFDNPTEDEWNYLTACFLYGALALWDITIHFQKDDIILQLDHDECATLWAGPRAPAEVVSSFRSILSNARSMLGQ